MDALPRAVRKRMPLRRPRLQASFCSSAVITQSRKIAAHLYPFTPEPVHTDGPLFRFQLSRKKAEAGVAHCTDNNTTSDNPGSSGSSGFPELPCARKRAGQSKREKEN